VFLLLLSPLVLFCQKTPYNSEFSLVFGDCFHRDSLKLKIQGTLIFSGIISSNTAGRANLHIDQYKSHLSRFYNGKTTRLKKVKIFPSLSVDIYLNGTWRSQNFYLKKGAVFLVQYCYDQKTGQKILTVSQGNDLILFF
jgi:hypothetical protein